MRLHKIPRASFIAIVAGFLMILSAIAFSFGEGYAASSLHKDTLSSDISPVTTIRFERIGVEDGLSQNAVLSIHQDSIGFLWFGTEDGLNKYDGYSFTVYKHDAEDPTSITDSLVSAILEDSEGNLWLGTRNGLDLFNRSEGTFTHFIHDPEDPNSLSGTWVVALAEGKQGQLWIGTDDGGLNAFKPEDGSIQTYRHAEGDATTLSNDRISELHLSRSGVLWIGTQGGLNRFNEASNTFTRYMNDPDDPSSISHDRISAIYEDSRGILWVGTEEEGGLNRFQPSTQTFLHYRHSPEDPFSLSHNRVRAIYEDRAGRLWIGTQNGLNLFDRERDRFIRYHHDPSIPTSLSADTIWSIFEDRTGVLWFGTYGGGINKFSQSRNRFSLYQQTSQPNSLGDNMVWSIHEDGEGKLWIGTFNGGLNMLDRSSDTYTVYQNDPEDPSSLSSNDVRALLFDQEGTFWIGTSGGLDRMNPETGSFDHFRHDRDDPNSLSENRVIVLLEDHDGNLWIGTRGAGLNRLDRDRSSITRFLSNPSDPTSLSDNRVWSLFEDHAGAIWVGTIGGLNVLDPTTGTFTRYLNDPEDPNSLSNDAVFSIHEDSTGDIWVGTWGGGLNRLDRESNSFDHFMEKQGLPNNVIYGIEADSEGHLWMSTNAGLSRFDPGTMAFRNYDVSDGLQDNEFNVGAHFRSASGEMFFGGVRGFNAFHPDQVPENPHVPPIVVTTFSKFNEPVRTDLVDADHLELSYEDTFISFEFAALDFNAPEKNRYAYMLEGFDQEWVDAGYRRYAGYTNLRGGEYVFRVKGSNNDGVWDEEGIAIQVNVQPPFWDMWWFRGAVLLVLIASLIGGYRLRVRNVEARSHDLEKQVKERTHELSTLLQLSQNIASTLKTEPLLELILNQFSKVVEYRSAAILIVKEKNIQVAAFQSQASLKQVQPLRFTQDEAPLVREVIQQRKPVIIPDVYGETALARRLQNDSGDKFKELHPQMQSWMGIPLIVRDEVMGMLSVSYSDTDFVPAGVADLTLAFANQAAIALENSRLFEDAEQRTKELEALYHADEELLRFLSLDDILQALIDIATIILHADKSSILVWEDNKEKLVVRASTGFSPETLNKMAFAPGEGTIGLVAATGRMVALEDVANVPEAARWFTQSEGIHSIMNAPLKVGGEIFGVFNVNYSTPRGFDEEHQRLFNALAQRAALAIENAQLYERSKELAVVEERSRLARDLHDAVTQTLFSASLIAEVLPRIWERDQAEGQRRLEELRELTRGALAEMRTLLLELRPSALLEAELPELLRQLAESITGRARVPIHLEVEGECPLPMEVKIALYRIAQEALNNIAKHAGASQVVVGLSHEPTAVKMSISDDGQGFDQDQVSPESLGLGIMRDRAKSIGARLEINSEIDGGTEISIEWLSQAAQGEDPAKES